VLVRSLRRKGCKVIEIKTFEGESRERLENQMSGFLHRNSIK